MTVEQMGLSVSLEAELSRLEANMKKAGRLVDTTAVGMDRSTKRAAKSFNQLEASLDPVSRAAQKLQRDTDKVRIAQDKGLISAERAAQTYARLNANYENYTARLGGSVAAVNRAGRAANDNAASYRRFGAVAQQAGYQVGDFAVQVASGGNPLVAFTQQASQLLGVMGPWGAVIGAAAAIAGGLAIAFWDVDESADSAADSLKTYEEAVKSAETFIKRLNDETKESSRLLRDERDELLESAKTRVEAASAALQTYREQVKLAEQTAKDLNLDTDGLTGDKVQFFDPEERQELVNALAAAEAGYRKIAAQINAAIKKNEEFKASSESGRQAEKIQGVIDALEYEVQALSMSERQQAINNSLRRAGAGITDLQAESIRNLAGELYDYEQRLDDLNDALDREQKLMDEGASVTEANRTAQEKYNDEIERLDGLLAANAISQETYGRAASKAFDDMAKAQSNVGEVGKDVGQVLSRSLSDVSGWADDARGSVLRLAEAFGELVFQKSVMDPAADALSGAIGDIEWGDLFGFADGGIMTGNGPLPLRKYSEGGIANSPQLAMFGEASVPEAYVPVPSGKIPVDIRMPKMPAQSNGPSPVFHIDARGADQAAIARLEGTITVLGGEIRRLDSTFDKRAVGAVGNAARRGGSASAAIRGR